MSDDKQMAFREQVQHVIQEAWEINGVAGIAVDGGGAVEIQLRILNGLLAMALTEICAPPVTGQFGSLVRLRDAIERNRE